MNYIRTTTYTAIILLLCTYVSFAEETKYNFKVTFHIGGDKWEEQTVESYISRELRSLRDVTIVDLGEEWDCALDIIITKVENVSDLEVGFAISIIYRGMQDVDGLFIVRDEMYDLMLSIENLPETKQRKELVNKITALQLHMNRIRSSIGSYSVKANNHFLYVGGIADLRRICETAIVDFDNVYLKEKRKSLSK